MLAINPKFLKPIVEQEVRLYKNSEDYKELLNRSFSQREKDTIKILSVYDRIQKKILDVEIDRMKKNNSFEDLVGFLYDKCKDIRFLETELFKLSRSEQLEDDTLNSYYGMISNETIDLFEMIENEFEGSN